MAMMLPDVVRDTTTSTAERRLFVRLRRELPDTCRVLHSLGLKDHPKKLAGEADFVVVSPFGVFVLEVKGGQVACKAGMWIFTGKGGLVTERAEGPFKQAESAMFHLRDLMEEHRDLRRLLWGYGVVMPDEIFTATSPEISQGVLLDRRTYERPLDEYLARLSRYWAEHYRERHRTVSVPTDSQIEGVSRILRPDVTSRVTVGNLLAGLEREQSQLTEEQARVLHRLEVNPRTEIRGAAGTGKTYLALDFASRRAAEGQRVLYLCFNRLLGQHVKVVAQKAGGPLTADSLHGWFAAIIAEAGLSAGVAGEESPGLFNEVYPSVFEQAAIEIDLAPFDCLVIDEAQDLLRARFVDALDLILKGGLARGSWHIFMDPNQAIFSEGIEPAVVDRLRGYGRAEFLLTVNCRNTREIAITTSIISGIAVPLEGAVEGGVCSVGYVPDGTAQREKALDSAVRRVLDAGIREDELVVLSARTLEGCGLTDSRPAGRRLHSLAAAGPLPGSVEDRAIDFSTMQAFKGLERRAVIAWDLDCLEDKTRRLLHYCGLTRARSWLSVLVRQAEREAYEHLSAEFGRQLGTSGG